MTDINKLNDLYAQWKEKNSDKNNKDRKKTEAMILAWQERANNEEWKEKNKKVRDKVKIIRQREVVTPFGNFNGRNEFDAFIETKNTANSEFRHKQEALPHLYYYKDEGPGEVVYEEVYYTPYGCCSKRSRYAGKKTLKDLKDLSANAGDDDSKSKIVAVTWFKKMSNKYPEQYYKKIEIAREWLLEDKGDK